MTNNTDFRTHSSTLERLADGFVIPPPTPAKRGFAAMDESRQRDIASKGGASVPTEKRSFSRDRELAVRAGRKGGQARVLAAKRRSSEQHIAVSVTQPTNVD